MKSNIIAVRYTGGAFVPLSTSTSNTFKTDEIYYLRIDKKRYWPRHQWFMVLIREAWESLPDALREKYPNPDVLRKRLLIAAGYADIRSRVCRDDIEAASVAAFMRPLINDYTILSVQGSIIVIMTAQSQSTDAMDADTFRKSVEDVQDQLAILLGCSKEEIREHAERLKPKRSKKQAQLAP